MISLLFNNWRFLLDAVLIIALIVLIFLWNPFGIFGGGLKLGTTTNMVTEIREIGQLVTAEYYGEVIASIDESRLELIDEDSLNDQAGLMYTELRYALYHLYQFQQIPRRERIQMYKDQIDIGGEIDDWKKIFRHEVGPNNISEKLSYHQSTLQDEVLYNKLVEYLWRQEYGKDKSANAKFKDKHEEQILISLYHEIEANINKLHNQPQELYAFLDENFTYSQDFSSFYREDFTADLSRKERNKKLAMVGRGWVKAGFDFTTLDEQTFYFHEGSSELHFFGLEPKILNTDINPWFIPEKGIPGFEVIDYEGKVNFKDAKKVKEHCIHKLTLYAHRADILKNAQKQGEETLKSFFSLLTGKEIKKVHFHNDRLVQLANEVAEDEFVNYYEAQLLDSLFNIEFKQIDSLRVTAFNRSNNQHKIQLKQNLLKTTIARLRKLPFEDTQHNYGYYSMIAFRIAHDETLDPQERQELEDVRWENIRAELRGRQDSVWFEDSLNFMMEYNAALNYLIEKCHWMEQKDTVLTLKENEDWQSFLDSTYAAYAVHNTQRLNDSIQLKLAPIDSIAEPDYFLSMLHPFDYQQDTLKYYMQNESLFTQDTLTTSDKLLTLVDDSLLCISSIDTFTEKRLRMPFDKFFDRHFLKHISSFSGADSLSFIYLYDSATIPLDSTNKVATLSKQQADELRAYYKVLCKKDSSYNAHAIVRASEWVREKLNEGVDFSPLTERLGL